MKNVIIRNLLVIGMLACTVITGHCQGTFYTSRSIFEAALGASTTITFEDIPSTIGAGLGELSVASSGVLFTNPAPLIYVADPNGDYHPIPGTGKYIWNFDGGYPVSIILPAGMTAFARYRTCIPGCHLAYRETDSSNGACTAVPSFQTGT